MAAGLMGQLPLCLLLNVTTYEATTTRLSLFCFCFGALLHVLVPPVVQRCTCTVCTAHEVRCRSLSGRTGLRLAFNIT